MGRRRSEVAHRDENRAVRAHLGNDNGPSEVRHCQTCSGRFRTDAFNLSGWILRLHDQFYWVTAGHCLKNLDDGIRDGTLRIIECGFADYFGEKAKHGHNVPFGYEPGCGFYIDDDTQGLDFGVIPLSFLTVLNLIANGVKAIGSENWERNSMK